MNFRLGKSYLVLNDLNNETHLSNMYLYEAEHIIEMGKGILLGTGCMKEITVKWSPRPSWNCWSQLIQSYHCENHSINVHGRSIISAYQLYVRLLLTRSNLYAGNCHMMKHLTKCVLPPLQNKMCTMIIKVWPLNEQNIVSNRHVFCQINILPANIFGSRKTWKTTDVNWISFIRLLLMVMQN